MGKTAVAVEVCRALGGEIVSIDSRQVFRGIEVVSNAPTAAELKGVACHLVGVLEPLGRVNAARYVALAQPILDRVRLDGRLPVLTAGTGLYLKALLEDLPLGGVTPDAAERARLEAWAADDLAGLLDELRRLEPASAAAVDPHNPVRVVRQVELARARRAAATGAADQSPGARPVAAIKVGLAAPREVLYGWIEARVDKMLERGWREEVEALLAQGIDPHRQAFSGIGVAEMADVVLGQRRLADARGAIAQKTRNYAKRQMTWFRADPEIEWLDVTALTGSDIVERVATMLKPR